MKKVLVFATNNAHKLEEVQAMVGDKFILKSLGDIGCTEDIAETGKTFEENASIKSQYIYKAFKIDCFADDSGLEVGALGGEPGVFSARYSGSRDPAMNLNLVLEKLEGCSDRKASFRTVISLISDGEEHFFEGAVHGTIRLGPSGSEGFGYDPVFQPDGYSQTFAEMPADEKNVISHRAIAIEKMLKFLKQA